MEICAPRTYLGKQMLLNSKNARQLRWENMNRLPMAAWNFRMCCFKLIHSHELSVVKHPESSLTHRRYSLPISLEESTVQSEDQSGHEENVLSESQEELLSQPLSSDQLKELLADSEREKLVKKLSQANQHNRLLKRQLRAKEDDLIKFKTELASLELEIQNLVNLAEEIAKSGIPDGSRKIKGKYIQSHLFTRLEAVHEKIEEQIKDVDLARSKEVTLFWYGVAESVQVMGTFDGWSVGEDLSPEYTDAYSKFSTTLLLRPGKYEIKFVVDGDWQLSPEFPTVGEGLTENNLLIVE